MEKETWNLVSSQRKNVFLLLFLGFQEDHVPAGAMDRCTDLQRRGT